MTETPQRKWEGVGLKVHQNAWWKHAMQLHVHPNRDPPIIHTWWVSIELLFSRPTFTSHSVQFNLHVSACPYFHIALGAIQFSCFRVYICRCGFYEHRHLWKRPM